jgi:ferredoxin-NADP reductase
MLTFETTVTGLAHLTDRTIELTLTLPVGESFSFTPGQFVQFILPEVKRSYSIASLPSELPALRFLIGMIDGGVASAYLSTVKVGDRITVTQAMGRFVLADSNRPSVFVATGVGVAPFASMVAAALAAGYAAKSELLFGVRHEQDFFSMDVFTELQANHSNFKFTPSLTQPSESWTGARGRVTQQLQDRAAELSGSVFYLCGGVEMVKSCRALLMSLGVPGADIKLEVFS